ncbi:MAG: type II CRISPR RNA-guided endonuclease Cas9 [Turicibacter sp.]|nr:type II CRISPR RNA-guided endonuclease Cas9 [Turicibacter sp.]
MLFNGVLGDGETYVDEQAYYKAYPTIYHLRKRLVENPEQADLRLVYLALHHLLKFRGHFVNQGQEFDLGNLDVADKMMGLLSTFTEATKDVLASEDVFAFEFDDCHHEKANEILKDPKKSRSQKAFQLAELFSLAAQPENFDKHAQGTQAKTKNFLKSKDDQIKALFSATVGNGIDVAKIFGKKEYKPTNDDRFKKAGDFKYAMESFDDELGKLESVLDEAEFEVLLQGKQLYEAVVLSGILTKETLSASMVEKYEQHQAQLVALKSLAKGISPACYADIFKEDTKASKQKKHGAYFQYIQGVGDPSKRLTREAFYKELKGVLEKHIPGLSFKSFHAEDLPLSDILTAIHQDMEQESYLPKQRVSDNGAIPYQIHEHELVKILENQREFYPFLGETHTIQEENAEGEIREREAYKIQTLFKFRIPYYVGTLAKNPGWVRNKHGDLVKTESSAKNAWVVRKSNQKLNPWNFPDVIDKEKSAVNFIERMTNFCTYLPMEKVLPKHSLMYQEFTVYNELIVSGYFGKEGKISFDAPTRQKIMNDLFKKYGKVSAQRLMDFLNCELGLNLRSPQELFGIDTAVKSPGFNASYASYRDLIEAGIPEEMIEANTQRFEDIIKWQTIFEEKKERKKAIRNANENQWDHFLTDQQVNNLAKKHYTGWGRLSQKLLTGIPAKNGKTILENLKEESNGNFMRLLEDEAIAKTLRQDQLAGTEDVKLSYARVESLAGSPALKKGIWQSLQLIKELERYLGKGKISKIVVEMAREHGGGRSQNRLSQLQNLYKNFSAKSGETIDLEVSKQLGEQTNEALQKSERRFLYFLQNGRCMYTDDALELSNILAYEVDHIIPQMYVKDDSIDNKVLVTKKANQDKGGDVPSKAVIQRMEERWEQLAKGGMISPKKLASLKKGKLGKGDIEGFTNRQLVETRQITKHVAAILADYFKNDGIQILTPKSSLTTQFRQGVIYLPKNGFDPEKAIAGGLHFEMDGKVIKDGELVRETSYNDSKFVKLHFHEGFPKNRDLNDYHHAHDAYLNAVVAHYVYHTTDPDLRKLWVYGEYLSQASKVAGKTASQRQGKHRQLLSGMADENYTIIDGESGEVLFEWDREAVLAKISWTLGLRGMNVVKKTEIKDGKYGDESVYQKDATADNFAAGIKRNLDPLRYGGTKAPISALTVLVREKKGLKPLSIPAMVAGNYKKSADKVGFIQGLYPKQKISEVVVAAIPKGSKYLLPSGEPRRLASFQEAATASQFPMHQGWGADSTPEALLDAYDRLCGFIKKNKLFTEKKQPLLEEKIKEFFTQANQEQQLKILSELLGVTKGKNQGLKALSEAGLGTDTQRLKGENALSEGVTLIYQSPTGLYEHRMKL